MTSEEGSRFSNFEHVNEEKILARAPEDHTTFRLAQLLILIAEISPPKAKALGIERIGYNDFFAANPFAVIDAQNRAERARLHRAAFDERQLSYASTGSRFANRRQRLEHDLALLSAYRLVTPSSTGYAATALGVEAANRFCALYAEQYRESVRVVHGRIKRLSDSQLAEQARQWLDTPSLLLDLYGSNLGHGDAEKVKRDQEVTNG